MRPTLTLVAWLRIDCGHYTRTGACLREPSADYWCARCDTVTSASGEPAVRHFVATIRERHAIHCPPPSPKAEP
jgi:hypothetical protein